MTFQIGDRVVTNNLQWGTIIGRDDFDPSWFKIALDDGGRDLMNAPRLSHRHPFGDRDPNPKGA